MNIYFSVAIWGLWVFVAAGFWLGWQLLRQNGRILLRLDELEQRLEELEFGEAGSSRGDKAHAGNSEFRNPKSETDQSLVTSAATLGSEDRASKFANRSLARSGLKRDGLKAGKPAPNFRLPRLDGRGDLSLEELRGRRILLVFSDPNCGPCQTLAPELEKFHRESGAGAGPPSPGGESRGEGEFSFPLQVVVISRGEPKENRAKVKEHKLTFPVVLQQQWEISRLYAMFATPIAYLIDEVGIIKHDVAVGVEPILRLMAMVAHQTYESEAAV